MKTKEIKSKIKSSFETETPNNLNFINEKCNNVTQLKKEEKKTSKSFFKAFAFTMCAVLVFSVGVVVGNFSDNITALAAETSIYLDVNPSIEIKMDKHHHVRECVANNEDGEKILENIRLNGVEVETALYAIVGSMYTNGYLNEDSNSILVSVLDKKGNNGIVLDDITNQINNVFKENINMECSIIAQKIDKNEQLKEEADQYGISVGKLKLIKKIIETDELYTEEDVATLAQMSIQELNHIYQTMKHQKVEDDKQDKDEVEEDDDDDDEVVTGKPVGFLEKEQALELVLAEQQIVLEDLQEYEITTLFCHGKDKDKNMVYLVSILRKDTTNYENYVVDCKSGLILENETIDEWTDRITEKEDNKHHFNPEDDYHKDHDDHEDEFKPEEPGHFGEH